MSETAIASRFKVSRGPVREALRRTSERLERAHARIQRNLQAAAAVQRSLLPDRVPVHEGAVFAWHLDSSDELAGDTLNIFDIDDDHVGFYVLDVSGHGTAAALLSVSLHHWLAPDPERSVLQTEGPNGEPRIL